MGQIIGFHMGLFYARFGAKALQNRAFTFSCACHVDIPFGRFHFTLFYITEVGDDRLDVLCDKQAALAGIPGEIAHILRTVYYSGLNAFFGQETCKFFISFQNTCLQV